MSLERPAVSLDSPAIDSPAIDSPASGSPGSGAESSARAQDDPAPPKSRRRLLWSVAAIAVVLLLGLTPPLLNVSRLRRRITASMSASLGRPVHLDSVALHLLPVPGFTLTNLVVSEDPAFGYEPVIRAMTVEATLRPSSLWRRQVEFSTIRFVEPSVNLVRNAQGQWNLQSLLMHAAQVNTAPTAQRKPGPEPRFPYIEATGARVNLKLGEEKQPFALTDADFALWLPSPQQWQVRIEAKPERTDTNIGDPGTVRIEGSMERATTMAEVPVDLTASWRDAPLGEASKLLTGDDAGWRGTLNLDAALSGTLGAGKLTTGVHINDLRRADFIPARLLDLNLDCSGTLETTEAIVQDPQCLLRSPRVNAIADSVDLTAMHLTDMELADIHLAGLATNGAAVTGLRVGSAAIPERWLLDWARLFSRRIPAAESGTGNVAGSVVLGAASGHASASKSNTSRISASKLASLQPGPFLQGQIHGDMGDVLPGSPPAPADVDLKRPGFLITFAAGGAVLAPLDLMSPGKLPPLMLSGVANRQGYRVSLQGTASTEQIRSLRGMFPPLTDGLEQALPATVEAPSLTKPMKIDVTCTRLWGAAQTCAEIAAAPAKRPHRHRR
jgi:hypothetical protein